MENIKKFLSFEGILGRREFIINYLIITIIANLIFNSPVVAYILINPSIISTVTTSATAWWLLLGNIISACAIFPSIIRRIRDVAPEQEDNNIYLYSIIVLVIMFLSSTTLAGVLFQWLNIAAIISLMCLEGTTSNKPKDEVIRFNWGAFLGTWIWGLFNKAPITLLMIPLFFTTASLPFALLCGIKGNEWAYKNKKEDVDLEKFHRGQKNQAIIWSIFIPIVYIVLFIFIFVTLGMAIGSYAKTHPDFKANIEKNIKTYQEISIKSYFSDIKQKGDEYQFYIDPKTWKRMSNSAKMSAFNSAKEYVEAQTPSKKDSETLKIMNHIKIYSSFNNELLGEYNLNEEVLKSAFTNKKAGLKEFSSFFKLIKEGYSFNNNPSIP